MFKYCIVNSLVEFIRQRNLNLFLSLLLTVAWQNTKRIWRNKKNKNKSNKKLTFVTKYKGNA